MTAVPPGLQLSDAVIHFWTETADQKTVSALLAPLTQIGLQLRWAGSAADLPEKYFGPWVDDGHVLCWSKSWCPREQPVMDLVHSAQPHQYFLLDLDGSLPARIRAQGLAVNRTSSADARVQLQVLRFVLNRLEWAWGRQRDQATILLPAMLSIEYNGQQSKIPAKFDGLIAVGRSSHCQIQLASNYVSRMHGCFQATAEGFSYRDTSQNGTVLVQGHEEIVLHESEVLLTGRGVLHIGDQVLSFNAGAS